MKQESVKLDKFTQLEEDLLEVYPELDRLIMLKHRLISITPTNRGALVNGVLSAIEITIKRFVERIWSEDYGN